MTLLYKIAGVIIIIFGLLFMQSKSPVAPWLSRLAS